MKMKRSFGKPDLIRLICIILFAALFVWAGIRYARIYSDIRGGDLVSSAQNLRELILSFGSTGLLVMLFLQTLHVIISFVPAMLVQFASGLIFGVPLSMLTGTVGAAAGTAATFYLSRFLGRDFVTLFVSKNRLDRLEGLVSSDTSAFVILCLFVLPVPKDFIAYFLGLTSFRASKLFIISAIGRLPGMFVSSYLGANFLSRDYAPIIVTCVFVAAMLILSYLFKDRLLNFLARGNNP